MKAVIIGGGYGTRMHPLTLRTPKLLLPIAGKPNITWLIKALKEAGIENVYLSINTNQLKVKKFLGNNEYVKIILEESTDHSNKLGSIGAIKYIYDLLGDDDYLIIGADNHFSGLSLKEFSKFHDANKGLATIALFELPNKFLVENYGVAVTKNNRIIGFQEKPRMEEAKSKLASTLVYKISRGFFSGPFNKYLESAGNLDTIGALWEYFSKTEHINGYKFAGLWGDIGKPKSYIDTNAGAMNLAKCRIIDDAAEIPPHAIIKPPVIIEKGCIIGKNTVIGPCTHLMHDTLVGDNSIVTGSIVFEEVRIGDNSKIRNSIIDGHAWINDCVTIDDYSIVGFKSVIKDKSHIFKHSRVWPYLAASGIIDGDVLPTEFDNSKLKNSMYWV